MRIGFIGLGNVGGKLAGSLLRNNFNLTVRDLDKNITNIFHRHIILVKKLQDITLIDIQMVTSVLC